MKMTTLYVGNGSVQVKGGNLLTNCFHPCFGWVWSDGCSVFLLPCSDDGLVSDSSTSRKLGEYCEVMSVAWSSHTEDISLCFLAVQEKKAVTLWEVIGRGVTSEFKLKRKIDDREVRATFWHPIHPIICLLRTSGVTVCSLAPDWSVQLADGTTESYQTGCWTLDGNSLVLARGDSVEVFEWEDILKAKDTWRKRNITLGRVHGKVRYILGLSSQRIIVTTDLPLTEIIAQSTRDEFEPLIVNRDVNVSRSLITEVSESLSEVTPKVKTDHSGRVNLKRADIPSSAGSSNLVDKLKKEITSHEKGTINLAAMMSVYSSGQKKVTHIEEIGGEGPEKGGDSLERREQEHLNGVDKGRTSALVGGGKQAVTGASDLFMGEDFIKREDLGATKATGWNLLSSESQPSMSSVPVFKQRDKAPVDDSAHVHLVDLSMPVEGAVLDSAKVPGIISPDLMTFQVKTSTLFIGSRSNQHIQLYRVQQSNIVRKVDQILSLQDQERPVGISSSSQNDVITVLVSQPVTLSMQGVFPTASGSQQVKLSFRQVEWKQ